jgi:hypothetical protein
VDRAWDAAVMILDMDFINDTVASMHVNQNIVQLDEELNDYLKDIVDILKSETSCSDNTTVITSTTASALTSANCNNSSVIEVYNDECESNRKCISEKKRKMSPVEALQRRQ